MSLDPNHIRGRIKALRELRGWTQTELTEVTGMSQPLVSALERGDRTATFQHVRILVDTTGTPERFFTADVLELTEQQLHFRRNATASTKSGRMVVRKFLEARYVAKALAATYTPRVVLSPIADQAVSAQDLEDLANDVRRALGVTDDEPIRHVIRSCERAGFPVVILGAGDGIREDHCGVSHTDGDGFGVIAVRDGQPGDQLRMTVGHELAHRLLHVHRTLPEKQREEEAFRLAGALLFPQQAALAELSDTLTVTGYMRLKARWGISIQALIMRAYALGVIDADRRTSLFRQISRRGWRTSEPVEVGVEQPALLWHLLNQRYGPQPYRPAEGDLGQARIDLLEWIPSQAPAEPAATGATVIDLSVELARRRMNALRN